jgi:putative ABC transport system permease protein
LDGSFVTGAGVFAKLVSMGTSPLLSGMAAMFAGVGTGTLVSFFQRGQKTTPLLAGILATFMLTSANLIMMGRPNINLLTKKTLVSSAFAVSETRGYLLVGFFVVVLSLVTLLLLKSPLGLRLRAFGDNPLLFARYGFPVESYRCFGFSFSNSLAACSGCLTAQVVGYADINMGLGITLTGLGAILAGRQLSMHLLKRSHARVDLEFLSCMIGILLYFTLMHGLLSFGVDPLFLKILVGLLLLFFLRTTRTLIL